MSRILFRFGQLGFLVFFFPLSTSSCLIEVGSRFDCTLVGNPNYYIIFI